MKKINWSVVSVIRIIAQLFLFAGSMRVGGGGMMGGSRYSPLGWMEMMSMWPIPVGLIALIVFGVV